MSARLGMFRARSLLLLAPRHRSAGPRYHSATRTGILSHSGPRSSEDLPRRLRSGGHPALRACNDQSDKPLYSPERLNQSQHPNTQPGIASTTESPPVASTARALAFQLPATE